MPSTKVMIDRLEGLLDTDDLSQWEQEFVRKMAEVIEEGQLIRISGKQVAALEQLHNKHFAG